MISSQTTFHEPTREPWDGKESFSSGPYPLGAEIIQKLESPQGENRGVQKLARAVCTILECIGEEPTREGLRATPERYANAMLYFTKGYAESVHDLVNGAVFHEGHDELVILRDIDVFSLCEHHLVPFTGKVRVLVCIPWHVKVNIWDRCISVIFRIAAFLVFPNWHTWLKCLPADYRFKSA